MSGHVVCPSALPPSALLGGDEILAAPGRLEQREFCALCRLLRPFGTRPLDGPEAAKKLNRCAAEVVHEENSFYG